MSGLDRGLSGLYNLGTMMGGRGPELNPITQSYEQQLRNYELQSQRMNALRTAQTQMPAGVREYEYYKNLSPEEKKAYDHMKRGSQETSFERNAGYWQDLGYSSTDAAEIAGGKTKLVTEDGVTRLISEADGRVIKESVSPEEAAAIKAQNEGAETTAQKNAEQTAAAMQRLREISLGDVGFEQATQQISGWIDKLKDGQLETGLVSGFLTELGLAGTELSGEALADSVEQALYNLQITNLAPVTEKEIQFIKGLFMDLKSPTEVNVGKLKAALRRINKAIEVADFDFKQQRNYVAEFGDDQQKAFIDRFFPAKAEATNPDGTGVLDEMGL